MASTPLKTFELGWRMATFGLFRLAQVLLTYMEQRGKGALLVTSATAAMRGNAGQHSHASAMGGRRWLCQSLNAQCASKRIHVAHIVIDGAVMLFEPGAIVDTSLRATATARSRRLWIHRSSRAICSGRTTVRAWSCPRSAPSWCTPLLLPPELRNEEILSQAKRLLTKTLEPLNEALAASPSNCLIGR